MLMNALITCSAHRSTFSLALRHQKFPLGIMQKRTEVTQSFLMGYSSVFRCWTIFPRSARPSFQCYQKFCANLAKDARSSVSEIRCKLTYWRICSKLNSELLALFLIWQHCQLQTGEEVKTYWQVTKKACRKTTKKCKCDSYLLCTVINENTSYHSKFIEMDYIPHGDSD